METRSSYCKIEYLSLKDGTVTCGGDAIESVASAMRSHLCVVLVDTPVERTQQQNWDCVASGSQAPGQLLAVGCNCSSPSRATAFARRLRATFPTAASARALAAPLVLYPNGGYEYNSTTGYAHSYSYLVHVLYCAIVVYSTHSRKLYYCILYSYCISYAYVVLHIELIIGNNQFGHSVVAADGLA